jgi:hypothetical protein
LRHDFLIVQGDGCVVSVFRDGDVKVACTNSLFLKVSFYSAIPTVERVCPLSKILKEFVDGTVHWL